MKLTCTLLGVAEGYELWKIRAKYYPKNNIPDSSTLYREYFNVELQGFSGQRMVHGYHNTVVFDFKYPDYLNSAVLSIGLHGHSPNAISNTLLVKEL